MKSSVDPALCTIIVTLCRPRIAATRADAVAGPRRARVAIGRDQLEQQPASDR